MNNRKKDGFTESVGIDFELPCHVGIIMDGNGRWAKKRLLPRAAGHRAGMERLHGLIQTASDMGISVLTLYAFSTENWKRPVDETSALFSLLIEYFNRYIDELHEKGVVVRHIGKKDRLPAPVVEAIYRAEAKTAENDGLILCLALDYGGRDEITYAIKKICDKIKTGELSADDVDYSSLDAELYTRGLPDVDLVIRTSGEQRISNFLLVQAAYAELIFTEEYFPDFSDECFIRTIKEYGRRSRRFGGV